jgi:hypothetical protein
MIHNPTALTTVMMSVLYLSSEEKRLRTGCEGSDKGASTSASKIAVGGLWITGEKMNPV